MAGTGGLIKVEGKLNGKVQSTEISLMKTCSRELRPMLRGHLPIGQ